MTIKALIIRLGESVHPLQQEPPEPVYQPMSWGEKLIWMWEMLPQAFFFLMLLLGTVAAFLYIGFCRQYMKNERSVNPTQVEPFRNS